MLEVNAVRPIEVIARFRPDLQLAWPAGFGGQYVFWDDDERAFVLSESRRQVNAFFGSPWATNNPSHMLADAPLPPPRPTRGERSSGMKLVSQRLASDTLVLEVEGLAGRTYRLDVRTPRGERSVAVAFPGGGDAVDGSTGGSERVTVEP